MRSWKIGDRVRCNHQGVFTPEGDAYKRVGTLQSFDGESVWVQFNTGMVFPIAIKHLDNVTKPPKREEDDKPIGAQIAERQRSKKKQRGRLL